MRVFYAHAASASPTEISAACLQIKGIIIRKLQKKFSGAIPAVQVVPGREDHKNNFRGDWDKWAHSVVNSANSITGKTKYDLFVTSGERCGRSTAEILDSAMKLGRSVFWWDGEKSGKLCRLIDVATLDAEDWAQGWKLVVDEPKMKDPQLVLPFSDKRIQT